MATLARKAPMKKRNAVVARRARAKSAAKQDRPSVAKAVKAAKAAVAARPAEPLKVPASAHPSKDAAVSKRAKDEKSSKRAKAGKAPNRAKAGKGAAEAKSGKKAKSAKPAKTTKPAGTVDRPRVRGTFAIPDADYARIASLKLLAKRAGFKVKKNELIRLGLRALQALNDVELQARVLALRDADRAAAQG